MDPLAALEGLEILSDIFGGGKKSSGSDDEDPSWIQKQMAWLRTPDPDEEKNRPDWEYEKFEADDPWHEFHLFHGWQEIINKKEWYDSPQVPQIYVGHRKILQQNMDMERPFETFYYQNADSNEFESNMYVTDPLPSDRGKFKLSIVIATQSPPSGENDAALVEYKVTGELNYDSPGGVTFLPRLLAYPLNRFFKWAFIEFIAEEQIEYDGEYARERFNEYFQYIRKYHGEEPIQTKSRQAVFQPTVDEGIFFE